MSNVAPMPVVFISHGSPMVAVEKDAYTAALRRMRETLPLPKAIVVALALPRSPSRLVPVGQALAPVRKQGVLLIGSGGVVHNLRRVRFADKNAPVEPWAKSFDDWVRGRVESGDVASLVDYQGQAPGS